MSIEETVKVLFEGDKGLSVSSLVLELVLQTKTPYTVTQRWTGTITSNVGTHKIDVTVDNGEITAFFPDEEGENQWSYLDEDGQGEIVAL